MDSYKYYEKIKSDRNERIKTLLHYSNIPEKFKDSTLDNYSATLPKQKDIIKHLKTFLESPDNVGLLMLGNPGTGKNHLVTAMMKEIIQKRARSAVITKVAKMIREIKDNWISKSTTEQSIIDKYVKPYLLVINEIGLQFGSDTERAYFAEIIDDRLEALKPTILIGNVNLAQIQGFVGERVIDRFRDGGKILVFGWDSHRGKKLND